MKTPRRCRTKADLSRPLNVNKYTTQDDDCFGKEWDISMNACNSCADNLVCGILFKDFLKKSKKKLVGSFIDNNNFELLDSNMLYDRLKGKEAFSIDEIYNMVKEWSGVNDEAMIENFLEQFFSAYVSNVDKVGDKIRML